MEDDGSVKRSLQEIAQLLLMIHEKYIKCGNNCQVLVNLSTFLRYIGLEDVISPLDTEYYLRKVYLGDNNRSDKLLYHSMGYEAFYGWLKLIACHFYQYDSNSISLSKNDKKSFHMLLTNLIIPFASKSQKDLGRIDDISEASKWLTTIDSRSLDTFVENKDVLKLWFMNLLIQVLNFVNFMLHLFDSKFYKVCMYTSFIFR